MPRDERGWRVDPAPDGRGLSKYDRPAPRRPHFIAIILGLLAINYAFVALLGPSTPRQTRTPYAPFFVDQVRAGHVQEISTQGSAIQGRFRLPVRYPTNDANDAGATQTTRFKTEVPTFADNVALSRLLAAKRVQINAKPISTGARCRAACCWASARRCCSSGCSCRSRDARPRAVLVGSWGHEVQGSSGGRHAAARVLLRHRS